MEKYDGIVIGFGKGGKTLAGDLANAGKKIAIIEKSDKMYGGTCINIACIPSKSLVNSAALTTIKEPLSFQDKANLYQKAIEEKRNLTSRLRKKNFDKLNNHNNVTIYTGTAAFRSPNQVSVELENETVVLEGEHIFINTGAIPILPDIVGVENNDRVYSSSTLMDLEKLPERLSIIGAGYIGLEFASIYSGFGSKVTVFQDGMEFLPREDKDIAEDILQVLTEKGIDFRPGSKINFVRNQSKEAVITYFDCVSGKNREHPADAVLIATGRKPNIEGLNLAAAGVELTPRSAIKVDEYLRTSTPNIWAMGDVTGGLQFTYISLDDYRIVRSQLIDKDVKRSTKNRVNVPYSIFIDPPYTRVGLNEREAIELGFEVKTAKLPVASIPKAQVLQQTKGILKAVIDAKTNLILGAMLFCTESHEMINVIKLAVDAQLPYTFLRDQIFTHPTMTESFNDLFSTIN